MIPPLSHRIHFIICCFIINRLYKWHSAYLHGYVVVYFPGGYKFVRFRSPMCTDPIHPAGAVPLRFRYWHSGEYSAAGAGAPPLHYERDDRKWGTSNSSGNDRSSSTSRSSCSYVDDDTHDSTADDIPWITLFTTHSIVYTYISTCFTL